MFRKRCKALSSPAAGQQAARVRPSSQQLASSSPGRAPQHAAASSAPRQQPGDARHAAAQQPNANAALAMRRRPGVGPPDVSGRNRRDNADEALIRKARARKRRGRE